MILLADRRRQFQARLGGGKSTGAKAAQTGGRAKRRSLSPEAEEPLGGGAAAARGLDARDLVRLKARKLSPTGEALEGHCSRKFCHRTLGLKAFGDLARQSFMT